jgi:hypothetical protein
MPFKYDPDGSLTLYFQNENPGKEKEANWLPAPKGSFNLTMRLYAPKSADREMESAANHARAGAARRGGAMSCPTPSHWESANLAKVPPVK